MEFVITCAIALAAGLLVGLLSGLLGIGGGVIMVPLFRLGFSLEPIMATATSLFCILPTSISGCITHLRNGTCLPRVGIALGVGGALLSPVGVWLASVSPPIAIMAVTAVIILYSAITMIRKALAADKEPAQPYVDDCGKEGLAQEAADCMESVESGELTGASSVQGTQREAEVEAGEKRDPAFTLKLALESAGIGALAGLCSGYVGVGGGFIMVPMMVSLLGLPMRKASGTSLIAIAILAIPALIEQIALGNVAILTGIAVACGSIPGAVLGANLVKRIPEKRLRLFFAAVLVVAAVVLVANEISAFA